MPESVAEGEPWEGARTIEATQARQSFRDMVDEAYAAGRRVVITRHKKPIAAIVAIKDFLRLRAHDHAADQRMLKRSTDGDQAVDTPLESLIEFFEQKEAANGRLEGGELRFDQITTEQLASEIVGRYVESPEFLREARGHVSDLINRVANSRESFAAADAMAIKRRLLAHLHKHGLVTKVYA